MITTFTATVLAGSLFLASTGTVEAPIRDYRSYLSEPAKSLAPALLASHPMLIKEHWLDKPIITASAVPYGSPKAPVVSRPVLLPMLLKEDWFRDRTLAASAVSPAAGPPSARLVRNERAISDQVAADAADLRSIASSG
ncbi:MAG: hypothetical protein M3N38_04450, partial [Pseudomonadota bacterium]|nr:hypothetical protein [Pseudomonadota bacterium]